MKDETKAEDGASVPVPSGSDSSFSLRPLSFHRIRLGPPWDIAPFAGGTRHSRKFGRPRTLDATERVWLVCEYVPASGEVQVNSTVVGKPDSPGPFAADITSLLRPRNEAFFFVESELPLGAVALEIRHA